MNQGSFRLTRAERISKSQDFSRAFKKGKRIRFPELTLVVAPNDLPWARIGISAGKRLGNAVKRNRAKRLCRELFRLNKHKMPGGIDIIFLPNKQLLHGRWSQLQKRMEEAGQIIGKTFGQKKGH